MYPIYDFERKIDELITIQKEKFKGTLEEYLRSIFLYANSYKDKQIDLDKIYRILGSSFETQQA